MRFLHVMGGVENCHSLLKVQFFDVVQYMTPALGVNTYCWLIHDDDCWFMHQSGSDIDPSFHAPGELIHSIFLPVCKPDDLQHFIHAFDERPTSQTIHPAPEVEIFSGR